MSVYIYGRGERHSVSATAGGNLARHKRHRRSTARRGKMGQLIQRGNGQVNYPGLLSARLTPAQGDRSTERGLQRPPHLERASSAPYPPPAAARHDKHGLVTLYFKKNCRFYYPGRLFTSIFSHNRGESSLVLLPCMLSGTRKV